MNFKKKRSSKIPKVITYVFIWMFLRGTIVLKYDVYSGKRNTVGDKKKRFLWKVMTVVLVLN